MDEAFQAILDSLPPKPARSKLEPYAELIRELRKRGRSYREIAGILGDRCGVPVATHTVYNFVQVRSRAKSKAADKAAVPEREKASSAPAGGQPESANRDVVAERIRALKQKPPPAGGRTPEKTFEYDENEPLRLEPRPDSEQKSNSSS